LNNFSSAINNALYLVLSADSNLLEIVLLSLKVSLSAVILAALVGLPMGALIAIHNFAGRRLIITILNSLMGLPPVVVGLLVYLLLSRAGPLGEYGLLFTPKAMVIAQTLLVLPIIAALTRQTLADLHQYYASQFQSFRMGTRQSVMTLLWEGRFSLLTTLLAGFGRATAEVGAVMIVGGNINHVTRVMTTSIVLETRKGDIALALGLGIILITIVILINGVAMLVQGLEKRT
jgi:tungstate transport system permease protein